MIARVVCAAVLAAALLGSAGCGPPKLDVSKTVTLDPGVGKAVFLDAVAKPQKVTVTFDSASSKVNVYVFKSADADENTFPTKLDKALAKSGDEKAGTVSVDVPENTATTIIVVPTEKKTDVKLHITNAKK